MQYDVALSSFRQLAVLSQLLYRAVKSAGTINCMNVLRGLPLVVELLFRLVKKRHASFCEVTVLVLCI